MTNFATENEIEINIGNVFAALGGIVFLSHDGPMLLRRDFRHIAELLRQHRVIEKNKQAWGAIPREALAEAVDMLCKIHADHAAPPRVRMEASLINQLLHVVED